jgi:hypothetical protein
MIRILTYEYLPEGCVFIFFNNKRLLLTEDHMDSILGLISSELRVTFLTKIYNAFRDNKCILVRNLFADQEIKDFYSIFIEKALTNSCCFKKNNFYLLIQQEQSQELISNSKIEEIADQNRVELIEEFSKSNPLKLLGDNLIALDFFEDLS